MPTWLVEAAPWLQGLFGGAGATLVWEGILKPGRGRRSLAHALAEELSHNLQYAAGQRLYFNHNPKAVPADFHLSDLVFRNVAATVGDLPTLIGDIVLVYRGVEDLNRIPEQWANSLREYRAFGDPTSREAQVVKVELDAILDVYRSGLETIVQRINTLLPLLRRASVPWYRIDLRLRKPKLLDLNRLAADVERLVAERPPLPGTKRK